MAKKPSKAEKRSVAILKEINKLFGEYEGILTTLKDDNSPLLFEQAIVMGLWLPSEKTIQIGRMGHSTLCNGLIKELNEGSNSKPTSLADIIGRM